MLGGAAATQSPLSRKAFAEAPVKDEDEVCPDRYHTDLFPGDSLTSVPAHRQETYILLLSHSTHHPETVFHLPSFYTQPDITHTYRPVNGTSKTSSTLRLRPVSSC